MAILVTGGAGYIGSHTVVELLEADPVPAFWADAGKAERELGWRAERGLEAMMADTWRWQKANRQGFDG